MFNRNRARLALFIGAVALVLAACNTTPPPPGPTFDLTVTVAGDGSVTSSPAGINTAVEQTAKFAEDSDVTLVATPAAGFTFDGWTGDCTGAGDCVVTMDAAKAVTATFSAVVVDPQEVTLTVTFLGDGAGTVSSGDSVIDCSATCTGTYLEGDTVTLTTVSDAGSSFLTWGGACSGSADCALTLDADTEVTAMFALDTSFSTFTTTITDGIDDAEEFLAQINATNPTGQVTNTSGDLDLAWDASGYAAPPVAVLIGLRFPNVTVPAGAHILSANVSFRATAGQNTDPADLIFHGEASVSPASYPHDVTTGAAPSFNISNRSTTTASATWTMPLFTNGDRFESADLSEVVTEIIDLDGWASGNALAFVLSGPDGQTSYRLAHSANSPAADSAPILTINYYVPPAP